MPLKSGEGLKDTAVFIATPEGVIAAINNEYQLGSASEMVASLLGSQGIALDEGDTVVSNDPYLGSAHVQDFYLLSPVHFKGAPILYLGAKTHLPDIGGDVEGGFNSRAEEIWAEGVRISPVKICRDSRVDTGIFNMILLNTRTAEAARLGLQSLIAAVEAGKKEALASVHDGKNLEAIQSEALQAIADTESRVRKIVSSWPSGEYAGECSVDKGSTKIDGMKIETKLTVKVSEVAVDFSMNAPQVKKPFNSSRGNTLSFALLPCLPLFCQDAMMNGGVWRAVTVNTKKGTLVDPVLPAPTSFAPFHVGAEISQAVKTAMEKFLPQQERDRLTAQFPSLLQWHPKG
jgi:N-methylhydantoinase B